VIDNQDKLNDPPQAERGAAAVGARDTASDG